MKITLNNYRFGVIVGFLVACGVVGVLEGAEVLAFGGLLVPWTARRAVIAILIGLAYFTLAYFLHRYFGSLRKIAEVEGDG